MSKLSASNTATGRGKANMSGQPHGSTPATPPVATTPVVNHGKLLRTWFLSLTKHERSCMLVLEDAKTVHSLLSMYTRKCEKGGDGYFYGVTHEGMDRISDSSGRQHHLQHHHGSSLMCTGGAESECSFCGSTNSTAYDGDILGWLTDDGGSQKRRRNRSSSSGAAVVAANQRNKANSNASSSLLSGLNLTDPFAHGASIFNTSSYSSSSSTTTSSTYHASQLLFSSKVNPLYHTARDLKEAECELERSVRLCDTRGYCDTLCVSSDLLLDPSKFVNLMDKISQQGFLSTPCYCTYDAKEKIWLWDVTAWFRNRNMFSLGAFIANKLEMVLWMRYWESTGTDPRKVPSGIKYIAGGLVRERLSSKSPLAHFWESLVLERREKMLTKLILLVDQHAHSLQHQYETLTGKLERTKSIEKQATTEEDASTDHISDVDGDEGDECHGRSQSSATSTPTAKSRRLRITSSMESASTPLSRTRSSSLPRKPESLPATSPTTPSSTNSAPIHSALIRPATATVTPHAVSSSLSQASLLMGSDHSSHTTQHHSPWSSMPSSFASSTTTSPSQSPMYASPAHQPPAFQLMANTHHVTSPAPGQLTPTLTHTHIHTHSHTHTHTSIAYSAAPTHPVLASLLNRSNGNASGLLPASTSTPPPTTALSTSPAPLPSLFKSSWDRDRSVGPDLVRELMATAAATQVKSALHVEKHKHLTAAYAAAAPDSSLTKEEVEKLKDLDYDFTMTGLELLSQLLSSLTQHNKRHANAIPRMVRATSHVQQPTTPLAWLSAAAQSGSPAAATLHATVAASMTPPINSTVISQVEAIAATNIATPTRTDSINSLDEKTSSHGSTMSIDSTDPPSESTAASPTTDSSASSSLGLVVGLSMPQLLLYAEREAASKSIAVAAARVESLRTSWPRPEQVDDWHFIELLFSSPLARAHTNLDKIIRRIGLLLQACYAEQIGVDLIMDEAAEQTSTTHTIKEHDNSRANKKKARKKKLKKKAKSMNAAEPDQENDKDEDENTGDQPDENENNDVATTNATATNDTTATAPPPTESLPDVPLPDDESHQLTIDTQTHSPALPPVRAASADHTSSNLVSSDLSPPSPAPLGRSLSSHVSGAAAVESTEPWHTVLRKADRKSSSGSAHATSSSTTAHSTPQRATSWKQQQRAKDDSCTDHHQPISTPQPLRTPPTTLTPARSSMNALAQLRTAHHAHHNSQPSATGTGGSGTSTTASAAGSTPTSAASPHFSSTLSFPNFGVRPMSWSAAARLKSTSTSASISPASTGSQTPTIIQPIYSRSKDDSFTQPMKTPIQRRASVTAASGVAYSLSPPPIGSSAASIGTHVMSFSEAVSSNVSPTSTTQHARNLSAGAIPSSSSSTNAEPTTNPSIGNASSTRPLTGSSRSPVIKSQSSSNAPVSSPSFFPMPQSPLLPTPSNMPMLQPPNTNAFTPSYGRTSTLHLAKPVPIHSSTSFPHHHHTPSSVGLSFSSVPAHHYLTHGQQHRPPIATSYIHGTDDVTYQAWQEKHQQMEKLAAHRWQQQQILQQHHSHATTQLVHAQSLPNHQFHTRVPRPSSARRATTEQGISNGSQTEFTTSNYNDSSYRPRSNSAGEESAPLPNPNHAWQSDAALPMNGSYGLMNDHSTVSHSSPMVDPSPQLYSTSAPAPISMLADANEGDPWNQSLVRQNSNDQPGGDISGYVNMSRSISDDYAASRPRATSTSNAVPPTNTTPPLPSTAVLRSYDHPSVSPPNTSPSMTMPYHGSVQMAQTYQRKHGGQDTPWLNASNRQRFAFSTHTGQQAEHTTPIPMDTHAQPTNKEQQKQQQQSQPSTNPNSDSRRSSLNAPAPIMPNFLVMPSLSSIAAQQQHQQQAARQRASSEAIGVNSPKMVASPPPASSAATSTNHNRMSALPPSGRTVTNEETTKQSSASTNGPVASPTSAANWSLRDSWKLHDEICVFSNYVSEVTTMRQPILLRMIELIRSCVVSLWADAEVECYGSFMTGLCLPSSDLDLVLKGVTINQQQALIQLSGILRKQKTWLQSLNAISTAKVPVIKLTACLEGEEIIVDITFDQQPIPSSEPSSSPNSVPSSPNLAATVAPTGATPVVHTGVQSVELIRHYLNVFPSLRPLALVLKQYLFERNLSNTYTGGLNSYCLILMIVGFLQSRPWPYQSYQYQQAQLQAKGQTQVLDQLMNSNQRTPKSQSGASSYSSSKVMSPQIRPRTSSTIVQQAVQRIEFQLQLEAHIQNVATAPLTAGQQQTNSFPATPNTATRTPKEIILPQLQLLQPSSSAASPPIRSLSQSPPSASSLSPSSSSLASPPTPAYGRASSTENLGGLLIEFFDFYGCHFDFQTMAIGVTMPPTWKQPTPQPTPPPNPQPPNIYQNSSMIQYPSPPVSASSIHQHPYSSSAVFSLQDNNAQQQQSLLSIPPSPSLHSSPQPPGSSVPPLIPLQQFNYLSLVPAHALPADWKNLKAEMAQLMSTNQQTPGGQWGHGVFYSLPVVSRVLVISDPFFPLLVNNIGKSVFAMWRIKQAFEEGHRLLSAKFAIHGAAPTLLARIIQKMQQHQKKTITNGNGANQTNSGGSANGTKDVHAPVKGLTHIVLPPSVDDTTIHMH